MEAIMKGDISFREPAIIYRDVYRPRPAILWNNAESLFQITLVRWWAASDRQSDEFWQGFPEEENY